VTAVYLPAFQTAQEAADWAAERGLVAVLHWGSDGRIRIHALPPDEAARVLERRGLRLVAVAEEMRP
jgi:hypothetical protein